ncbi:hypothetical protein [Streptomyces sp. AMCC400023]|uniref:hypothetical protein n=1 Tax=Streptomyces sp. AMCC400023 TaxID=2056258 RepID=UPI001F27919D|nr:hypothetical protein [Streptomyces sp. AMCC400023]UJV43822.1 hypothetical protein CVT30_31900 [Streptomyces sp. AMCC400023]
MGRRREQTTRAYPNAGLSVTGAANRFFRSKTTGAREADRAAQAWEDRDRQQDRRGRWYRPAR